MSTVRVAGVGRPYWRPPHRRDDSDELDVFEASKYFSDEPDQVCGFIGAALAQMSIEEERSKGEDGRKSVEIPMREPLPSQPCKSEKQLAMKEMVKRSSKQPSSPGGKLASFLNSLFNQASHRKKMPKSGSYSIKGDEDGVNPDGRRKIRRSSISHFGGKGSSQCSRSLYSSSSASSGFTTSPTISPSPIKVAKDARFLSDQIQAKHLSRKLRADFVVSSMDRTGHINGYHEKRGKSTRSLAFSTDVDDGAESDSSSDLFDLPNYDVGIFSKGLPVYQTTHIRRIKIDAINPVQVATSIIA